MKLHAAPPSAHHTVTACGDDYVAINGHRYERSLLLQPDRLDLSWGPASFDLLDASHLAPLADLACDVLLIGTGRRQHFLAPALLRPFYEAGRGVEIMSTAAACRTYNILMSEGRAVAAALIVELTSEQR